LPTLALILASRPLHCTTRHRTALYGTAQRCIKLHRTLSTKLH